VTETASARRPSAAVLLGALAVLGAALYLSAATAPPLLDEGERLLGLASGTPADAIGFKEGVDDFRPAANLVRHLLLVMGGTPTSLRVTAALLHGLTAVILFLIARRLVAVRRLNGGMDAGSEVSLLGPAACAIFFAVHPLCSEALLAHAAFPLVLGVLFAVVCLLLAVMPGDPSGNRPFASAVLFLAALLSDSSLWPVAFVAAAVSGLGVSGEAGARRGYVRRLLPYLAAIALFYVCWAMRGWPSINLLPLRHPWSFSQGLASQSAAFVSELRLMVAPFGLSVDHGDVAFIGTWNAWAVSGAVGLTLLLAAGLWFVRRATLGGVGIGLYSLLHVHTLIAPPEEPLSERRLYPMVAGIAFLAAGAVKGLERRGSTRRALVAAAAVSLVLGYLTIQRVDLWRDPAALWESAAQANATSPRPPVALAGLAAARGDLDEALRHYEAALARAPRSASIQHSIAEIYFRKGDYLRALQEENKAMDLDPTFFPSYLTAGNSFMMRNQPRDAFLAFNAALRLRPNDPSALFNMGVLLFDQSRFAKAAELLQQASQGRPRDPEILFRLGMARVNTGDLTGAAEALRGTLAEAPGRLDARNNLATVLTQMKHYEEAAQTLNAVIGSDPDNAQALNGMGVIASSQGQWPRSRDYFEKAVAADPNDLKFLYNLAGAYEQTGEKEKAAEAYRKFLASWTGGVEAGETARTRLEALEAGPRKK